MVNGVVFSDRNLEKVCPTRTEYCLLLIILLSAPSRVAILNELSQMEQRSLASEESRSLPHADLTFKGAASFINNGITLKLKQ